MMASDDGGFSESEDASSDDAYHLLARAAEFESREKLHVELHVELNVVPAQRGGDGTSGVSRDASLESDGETETETETERHWFGAPPASVSKKPPLVSARRPDEICVAWGRVPWPDALAPSGKKKKKTGTGPAVVDVALRGFGGAVGSDAISTDTDDPEGVLLPASAKAKASSAGFFRKFTEKAKRLGRGPTVRVRVAAPPPRHAAAAASCRARRCARRGSCLCWRRSGSCASARRALLAKRKTCLPAPR